MKLRDWLPKDFFSEWSDSQINKFLDYDVIKDSSNMSEKEYFSCPIKRQHIYNWCIISNGKKEYAIGWNENPSIGWSFPYKRLKETKSIMITEEEKKFFKEKFSKEKNKFDCLRHSVIVGYIDSYDAVHSVAISIDDERISNTHVYLFGPQCMKRWRWTFSGNLDFSTYYDGKPTIKDIDAIQNHLTRDYDIRWQDNGWHDWEYFVSKMSKSEG